MKYSLTLRLIDVILRISFLTFTFYVVLSETRTINLVTVGIMNEFNAGTSLVDKIIIRELQNA
ncbi:MAG: hypothetical protein LBI13_05725 [Streptococcaceae bacterium]|jgi:hypothetical protein|nr:hypothetical protein [Streptococcaceae bacterium]